MDSSRADRSRNASPSLAPTNQTGDRIVNQLMFMPPHMQELTKNGTKLKTILIYDENRRWSALKPGRRTFSGCPVNTCTFGADPKKTDPTNADAIVFGDKFHPAKHRRKPNQVWIFFSLEPPVHSRSLTSLKGINWTATYRHDSDIVVPYNKFVSYDPNVKILPLKRNYASRKTRKVAWFVSNCKAISGRLDYARELAKHIQVDIYGKCGNMRCPINQTEKCRKMLDTDYKFYLAFENSYCKDYITEKFYETGLQHDVVPIVLGARKEDYANNAPPHSFISIEDFDSPKSLAKYLHRLDKNDGLYNNYFRWKGTGEFVKTNFWCRVCALLHDELTDRHYENIEDWWHAICVLNT
uniref:Fucosyltransferase n=1 Tax=Strigamia maritima TaxID=126957 RepID=T1IXX4_STRMM